MAKRTTEERFWEKVDKNGPIPKYAPHLGRCWLWTAGLDTPRYGQFWADGARMSAHRFAHLLLIGPIQPGYEVDHLCRVRHCVRPSHLEAVTPTENKRRSGAWEFWRNKTHCPQGHPYSGANLYITPDGDRTCRKCRSAAVQRAKARRRSTRAAPDRG